MVGSPAQESHPQFGTKVSELRVVKLSNDDVGDGGLFILMVDKSTFRCP